MTYYVASGSGTVDCGGASTVTTVTGQGATGINITVPAYRISGTVRDSAQQPIANMQVSASDATSGFRDLMYTGTDGIYSVTVLPGDTITLNVSPPSQYVATSIGQISVMTSNISQDFMLVNAHLVSGRVIRTGDSLALPFATVTMWTSGGGFVTDSVTDSLGQYGMWVAGGTYRVSAQATGYTTTWWMNAADLASANDIPISNADVPLSDIALP